MTHTSPRPTPSSPLRRRPLRARLLTAGLATAALLGSTGLAQARGFLPPLDHLSFPEARVITADGQQLYGGIPAYSQRFRGISRIVFFDSSGSRLKLRADEVQQVIIPVGPGTEIDMYGEVLTTVEKAIKADYELIRNVRTIVFDSIVWPESDRRLLLQRVNPGFDRHIQVYAMLNADEGVSTLDGVPWFGDEEKSYLMVKHDAAPVRVKKRHYKRDFERLFGDCQPFVDSVPQADRKFRHFADHVYAYQQVCSGETTVRPMSTSP